MKTAHRKQHGKLVRCANGVELRYLWGGVFHDDKRVFLDDLSKLGCIPIWTMACDLISHWRNSGHEPKRLVIGRTGWRALQREFPFNQAPALYSWEGDGPRILSVPIVVGGLSDHMGCDSDD